MTTPLDHAIVVRHGPIAEWTTHAEIARELAEAHARIRELETALATATQAERARCLAICRNRQHARSKHSQQLREEGSHDRSIWVHCKSTEAAACAEEIERGYVPPTQETP